MANHSVKMLYVRLSIRSSMGIGWIPRASTDRRDSSLRRYLCLIVSCVSIACVSASVLQALVVAAFSSSGAIVPKVSYDVIVEVLERSILRGGHAE